MSKKEMFSFNPKKYSKLLGFLTYVTVTFLHFTQRTIYKRLSAFQCVYLTTKLCESDVFFATPQFINGAENLSQSSNPVSNISNVEVVIFAISHDFIAR